MESYDSLTIQYDKTTTKIVYNPRFDNLPPELINEIFKDGRPFSHFAEHWLDNNYNGLTHVPGCKSYDFINTNNNSIKYDEKTFTKKGCNFMPSSMIGTGRKFNKKEFETHANELNYIIVSNVNFPIIKIKFITGSDLLVKYPSGRIPPSQHDLFFGK